jgi:hypothetical protein
MVAQLYTFAKDHWIIHLKQGSFVRNKLFFNKEVYKMLKVALFTSFQ